MQTNENKSKFSGNIKILGMEPRNNNEEIKALIGYISEEPLVYKSLSPREIFECSNSIYSLGIGNLFSLL